MLTIIAVFSFYDSTIVILPVHRTSSCPGEPHQRYQYPAPHDHDYRTVRTVTVYFRTKHVEVRALLIAGLTGMVRHILIYNMEGIDPMALVATAGLLAVLIAGIVLVRPESVS
jgi:hypothetical protein